MPETTEKMTNYDRMKELTDRLEDGMKELFQSDKYKDYLKSMSHFHNYSSRNIALINMQMPGATKVASFKLWDEGFNRHVKKGEKGIRIFAPMAEKATKEMEKLDPETGAVLLDENGKPIVEMVATTKPKFKLVPVFDVSQTYGDPLPELVETLTGNVEHYQAFMDSLKTASPLPIAFETMPENEDGYCRYGVQIGIREGMSETQTVAAVLHEIAHARLHDKGIISEAAGKPSFVKEIEAESVAYVVSQHYGIETAPNSFGYLASWDSEDMAGFRASLETIRKEAGGLINDIDEQFKAICRERGIDLTAKESDQSEQVAETPSEPVFTTETRTENIGGVEFSFEDIIPESPTTTFDQASKQATEPIQSAEIMPDPDISISEMINLYGYSADGMLPLTQLRALELFNQDMSVYLLYPDNTEAAAFDSSEIESHDGIFGVERDDWQRSAEYAAMAEQSVKNALTSETIAAEESVSTMPDEPTAINQAVYMESLPHARDAGEMERYNESRSLNADCCAAINAAINEARYDTNFYNMKDAVKSVVDTYGAERVELLMAKIVQDSDWDGRYSRQNKEWAKGFDIPQGMKDVYSNTHPCLLDGFLTRLREKPSIIDAIRTNTEKSHQKSEPAKEAKKSKEMEM